MGAHRRRLTARDARRQRTAVWMRGLLPCLALLAACDSRRTPGMDMPALALVDSVVLDDGGGEYIGALDGFAIAPDGSYFQADAQRPRVLHFSARGQRLGVYGRPGRGPGELDSPAYVAVVGDSLLLVADASSGQLELFDLATRAHRRTIDVGWRIREMHVRGDSVWLATPQAERHLGLARLSLRDTARQVGDRMERFFPYPAAYADSRLLPERYSGITMGLWGDTLLASYQGSPLWVLQTPEGRARDTIVVPAARRQGVPANLADRLNHMRSQQEQFSLLSWPANVARLPDGRVAVVHMYSHLDDALHVTMDGWLSVLSADLERACVDAPLALSQDGLARVGWRGDTLVTVEQVVAGEEAQVVVKRYRVSTDDCAWRPLWHGWRATDRTDDREPDVTEPFDP